MKKPLLLIALCAVCVSARANDSAISGTSGTPGYLKATQLAGEHKTIRMMREQIVMTIGRNDYVTDARFVFHNDGAATTVKMGFPEGADGDSDFTSLKRKTAFKEFQTWVDGREIKATRMVADANEEDFSLDVFWVKTVHFARGQTRQVRVRYRSDIGISTDGDFVFYDFTGGNWKGKVAQSTLRVKFTVPGTYRLFPLNEELGKYTWADRNNEIVLRWRDWQAQAGFVLRYLRTLPNGLVRAREAKELSEEWRPYSGMKIKMVHGKESFNPWRAEANWPPAALLRDGRAFIQFRQLSDIMCEMWENKNPGLKLTYGPGLRVKGNVAIAPFYGKPNQSIAVEAGKKTARVGERKIMLPVAPFRAGGVLYVPLAAMTKAMNGTAKVNTKTMRFWFDLPV
jgi:hypothetical protein